MKWWQSPAAFRLDEAFVASYATRDPQFGFNGLGEITYYRTYSRLKSDGTNEHWWETVRRVVEGTYRTQERWVNAMHLGWDPARAQESAQEMYDRIFTMKFLPPGRGLWAMGSALTEERGLFAATLNCAFVSTAALDAHWDPAEPFCWLMEASMLGIGVGFDTKGAGTLMIVAPEGDDTFVVPDDREGWVEALRRLLNAYFRGAPLPHFDYRLIRPAGTPIKGFGGQAGGPECLEGLLEPVQTLLQAHVGQTITSRVITDICNLIAKCVVAGNTRRSALIAFGEPDDDAFLNLKNYEANPERAAFGWTSNNSVFAELGQDYSAIAARIRDNGEPGVAWLDNMRAYSRMGERDWKDYRALGGNPCVPAGTRILTRQGYVAIEMVENTLVEVWNGETWSWVTPRLTGVDQELVRVALSDGRALVCTPYHEWVLADGGRRRAHELAYGDEVLQAPMPVVEGGVPVPNAYDDALYTGAPFEGDVPSRLQWLAGNFDQNGSVMYTSYGTFMAVQHTQEALRDIQLLLSTLGVVGATIQHNFLLLTRPMLEQLRLLGLATERWDAELGGEGTLPPPTVVSVQPMGTTPTVYCFDEPLVHQGTFEGIVTGQCLEQTLESYECCNLVELFLARHDSFEDFQRTIKFAYLYAKTVTLGPTPWVETNRIMARNRRIGVSQSGIVQALARHGVDEFRRWCQDGYRAIQHWDRIYSEWLCIPRSIKLSSCKPSGTVSLLAGATPGIHYPEARTYIRRIRIGAHSHLLPALKAAGYPIEPAVGSNGDTMVVEFPVRLDDQLRTAPEVSMWEQLELAAFLQEHWADNQVSCTVTFDPTLEGPHVAAALNYYQYRLKGISFLPRTPLGAFPQMPYEAISEAEYEARCAALTPLRIRTLSEDAVAERFCTNDSCTL